MKLPNLHFIGLTEFKNIYTILVGLIIFHLTASFPIGEKFLASRYSLAIFIVAVQMSPGDAHRLNLVDSSSFLLYSVGKEEVPIRQLLSRR